VSVDAYVARIDQLLTRGHELFPASGGGLNVGDATGPPVPDPPPGGGSLSEGVTGAAGNYRDWLAKGASLDADTSDAARDGSEAAAQGRANTAQIRDGARAQAAAIRPVTDSPAGVRLLVSSMDGKLGQLQRELDTANAQSQLIATRLRQLAVRYRGGMGGGGPAGGGGGMPIPGGGGGSGGLGGLSGLPTLPGAVMRGGHPGGGHPSAADNHTGNPAAAAGTAQGRIPPPAPGDTKAAVRYIYQAARARGYSDYEATAIAAYSLGEDASEDPTVSGGPQGGPGDENVVIGNFQEKPQFARDAGMSPADRFNVPGNTEAYLRTLERHRGEGDIFHQLFATSKGGPFYTGGYPAMERLMVQARQYLSA
jgi:hypothetical protein